MGETLLRSAGIEKPSVEGYQIANLVFNDLPERPADEEPAESGESEE